MARESGMLITIPYDSDKVTRQKTLMCVHCGYHWVVKPGSGRKRGWCQNCHGPSCSAKCDRCVPMRQYMDNLVKGRPKDFRPIQTSVAIDLPSPTTRRLRGAAGRRARGAKKS